MAALARLFNFLNATPAVADNVDAEFDQIIAFIVANAIQKDGSLAFAAAQTGITPTNSTHLSTKGYCDGQVSAGLPSGFIAMYGSTTQPGGWLKCDRAAVSRTTYAALFAVIGSSYGAGDGSTTFNVPDFRARVVVGQNPTAVSGRQARAISAVGGQEQLTVYSQAAPTASTGYTIVLGADNNMQPFAVAQYIIKT